jgi:hypothetical protein
MRDARRTLACNILIGLTALISVGLLFVAVSESRRRALDQATHFAVISEVADFHLSFIGTKGISQEEYVNALARHQDAALTSLLEGYRKSVEERTVQRGRGRTE